MANKIEALKAEIAYEEAKEKFIAAKLAWHADRSDAKLEAAYRKEMDKYLPLVDEYRRLRQPPSGPGDANATPGAIAVTGNVQDVGGK